MSSVLFPQGHSFVLYIPQVPLRLWTSPQSQYKANHRRLLLLLIEEIHGLLRLKSVLHPQQWDARRPRELYTITSGTVCLCRELWAGSLPPWASHVILKKPDNIEQQKSKMQDQAVQLFGQLLDELNILVWFFFQFYSFFNVVELLPWLLLYIRNLYEATYTTASEISVNTLQTRDNRKHLLYT